MSKIVIATKLELEVGKIYKGLSGGPWAEPQPGQCYRVVAKDTEQGWVDSLVSFHGEEKREWLEVLAAINRPWLYYEILTD